MDLSREQKSYLSLKVMRKQNTLTNKNFTTGVKDASVNQSKTYMKDISEGELISNSTSLAAKDSSDNIYLGATFDSYIIVTNESTQYAREVSIKVELQTTSQRLILWDTSVNDPIPIIIEPGKSREHVIKHEIKELGVHNMVCSLQYTTDEGEKRSFRKYYRFQVLNPFAVKTKVNNMGDGTVFLEVQIQNVAERFMYLEKMNFEPIEVFDYKDLNYVVNDAGIVEAREGEGEKEKVEGGSSIVDGEDDEFGDFMSGGSDKNRNLLSLTNNLGSGKDGSNLVKDNQIDQTLQEPPTEKKLANVPLEQESVFGNNSFLNPQDIRQYLYMLTPKPQINDRLGRTVNALGKLDIVWRSHLGETGRLQTSQLTRKPPSLDEIEFSVKSIPPLIQLEVPFKLGCRVRNRTTTTLRVVMTAIKNRMGSVLLSGSSSKILGELVPDGTIDFDLEFFPLSPGLQRVGGLKVTDLTSGYTKEIDHLTDVFVVFS
ncbi:9482_t:CDS:1 [Acaulospora colombiana]|uniref:9482_t:CDS:1 n=1 Tax=Acaulospora colombiana TaxID=27376 RepID=A0ACA9KPM0_9GLOM|nr:9482_t:CDS:1 [Acaulospora colombiana]